MAVLLIAALFVLVTILVPLPLWLVALYLVANLLCLVLYGLDKWAAIHCRRRVSERTLLVLGLLGAWPGAFVAQSIFRHKTAKAAFQRRFWFCAVLNLIACVGLATPWLSMLK
jgi:uncharacterized membrane protein YsdA (DUF1294 family)